MWLATWRHRGWVRTGQPGEREEEEGELANIWAPLTGGVRSRRGHMVRDVGKEEPASAGCLGPSASKASYSLTHSLERALNVHSSVQDTEPTVPGQSGVISLGNMLSGRGLNMSPHQPGRKVLPQVRDR